jgi:hypothetical protein
MRQVAVKDQILEDAGYVYNLERALYINRSAKKAFSIEFVEGHTGEQIQEQILRGGNGNGWTFYFNSGPTDFVRRELERILG